MSHYLMDVLCDEMSKEATQTQFYICKFLSRAVTLHFFFFFLFECIKFILLWMLLICFSQGLLDIDIVVLGFSIS